MTKIIGNCLLQVTGSAKSKGKSQKSKSNHPFLPANRKLVFGNRDLPTTIYLCPMLATDDLQQRWWNLEAKLVERFEKKPDLETVLFLIGMQETGFTDGKISKEQKQDLMHVAVCRVLMQSGYYELSGVDGDGWPHFKQLIELPKMQLHEQENFLKDHILLYFEQQGF